MQKLPVSRDLPLGRDGRPGLTGHWIEFFAAQGKGPIEIDEATDRRLRWMIHKRVLVSVRGGWYASETC